MSETLPVIYLARHGETEWSLTGQHTGRADIPLTANGEKAARCLGERLKGLKFDRVYTSPLRRAQQTCARAGFAGRVEAEPDLMEWNYGEYEGKRTAEIRAEKPDWNLFRDGCPAGETAAEIGARADRMIEKLSEKGGNALLFSHQDFLRVLAARWAGWRAEEGQRFILVTAAVSILGYNHTLKERVIRLWNDDGHLQGRQCP